MSSSRNRILTKIKESIPTYTPAPELNFEKWQFDDPVDKFCAILATVGGEAVLINSESDILNHLHIPQDAKVISAIETIQDNNLERDKIASAHDMKDIDFCCFKGHFAVAENAALYSQCDDFHFRSVYFLAENLVVTLNRSDILNNMHEAYERLKEIEANHFSAFISGPSKTADIEQSLVIGAHGARSLKVFILKSQ